MTGAASRRRAGPLAAALCLAGCGAAAPSSPAATSAATHIMSINQCTDQLVLALLPPSRIASVTWLSRDPRYSAMAAAAARVPSNRGGVEETIAARPDLIVTDTFSNRAGRALLERLHLPLATVPDAGDVAAIRHNVLALATTLRVPERGAALVARMDRQLAAPRPARPLRAVAWGRDGMARSPLLATAIAAAGLSDVTPATGPIDIEALLRLAPDVLVETSGNDGASLGDARRDHRIVRLHWPASRVLHVPTGATICGTPAIGDAAAALRAQVRALSDPAA